MIRARLHTTDIQHSTGRFMEAVDWPEAVERSTPDEVWTALRVRLKGAVCEHFGVWGDEVDIDVTHPRLEKNRLRFDVHIDVRGMVYEGWMSFEVETFEHTPEEML